MLRSLLGKLGHLGGHVMEQGPHGPLPMFKSRMDFFIGRSVKIHGTDPKLNAPVVQLLPDLSSY